MLVHFLPYALETDDASHHALMAALETDNMFSSMPH